jgi:hypothetical protein
MEPSWILVTWIFLFGVGGVVGFLCCYWFFVMPWTMLESPRPKRRRRPRPLRPRSRYPIG